MAVLYLREISEHANEYHHLHIKTLKSLQQNGYVLEPLEELPNIPQTEASYNNHHLHKVLQHCQRWLQHNSKKRYLH